jgi:dTDP-4-amino-4,6-dideoxygalactose transaminase
MSHPQNIPLIDVTAQNTPLKEEMLAAIRKVIENSAFILGSEVKAFEEEFQSYTRVNHAVSCASGSDALLLPLMAAGVKAGDEVLVPSFTFYATAGAVARLGATPVFVDSDEHYNISLDDMERKIGPRTKAVIPVHLFGQMVDMESLQKRIQGKGICVIEDCAQSIGAEFRGRPAGSWGDYGAFSFYPTKNLGAIGDAGMISARDPHGAESLRRLRVHGSSRRYYHEMVGVNSRLDSIQAAVLRIKLRYLRGYEEKREALSAAYFGKFRGAGLEEHVRLPLVGGERRHVWNQFTIRAQRRDELKAYLAKAGIGSEVYYPLAMHRQEAFAPFLNGKAQLPVCEALEREVLSLPIFPELNPQLVDRIVETIANFYRS